jgi:hypothetical protein
MAQKEAPKTMHRSMQGKLVDMNKLMNQNEMTIAVGNMNVNARGDKLGPGGTIIAKREQLQAGSTGIPDQINVRASNTPAPTPVTATAPVSPVTALPVKNVADMDPEGKE